MAERVTVVIPTRKRCRLLRQTLATVLAQDGVDVVIVDEGSTDETPEMPRAGRGTLRRQSVQDPVEDGRVVVGADDDVELVAANHGRGVDDQSRCVPLTVRPSWSPSRHAYS